MRSCTVSKSPGEMRHFPLAENGESYLLKRYGSEVVLAVNRGGPTTRTYLGKCEDRD